MFGAETGGIYYAVGFGVTETMSVAALFILTLVCSKL